MIIYNVTINCILQGFQTSYNVVRSFLLGTIAKNNEDAQSV